MNNRSSIYTLLASFSLSAGILLSGCSDFEPKGAPELPYIPTASDVNGTVSGRKVTLHWTLPSSDNIESIRVSVNAGDPTILPADATSYTFKGQAMGQPNVYTVKVAYKDGFVSEGVSTSITLPVIETKMGYLMTAPTVDALPDDDEQAAARWFLQQENTELIQPSQIATLDPDVYSVIWIEIDRQNLPLGWQNLPAEITSTETIDALKEYSANGGSLYLSNMATQLTVPLGIVPDNMAPTVYGNGAGGEGTDIWTINPNLGWDFQENSDQGFYDRTTHAIFKGLTLEKVNDYPYESLPLIGPGHREDHNCLWDCNLYGKGSYPDVIKNFEMTTNSLVLATWGHVRDHCVAGLVDFFVTENHGHCVANGFAAYEFNQNSGVNPYQKNIEGLTLNILNYLK